VEVRFQFYGPQFYNRKEHPMIAALDIVVGTIAGAIAGWLARIRRPTPVPVYVPVRPTRRQPRR
jgi:hypothetical protein